jgi:hypothetical protein
MAVPVALGVVRSWAACEHSISTTAEPLFKPVPLF